MERFLFSDGHPAAGFGLVSLLDECRYRFAILDYERMKTTVEVLNLVSFAVVLEAIKPIFELRARGNKVVAALQSGPMSLYSILANDEAAALKSF